MITAHAVELRVGARVLLEEATFRIAAGDRIGLVGRNGAGKTTLTKTLAGETLPTSGQITRAGDVGYLPQDPRTGDLDMVAMDRVLSARGLDTIVRSMRETEGAMASADDATRDAAMARYGRLDAEFAARGGRAGQRRGPTGGRRHHRGAERSAGRGGLVVRGGRHGVLREGRV